MGLDLPNHILVVAHRHEVGARLDDFLAAQLRFLNAVSAGCDQERATRDCLQLWRDSLGHPSQLERVPTCVRIKRQNLRISFFTGLVLKNFNRRVTHEAKKRFVRLVGVVLDRDLALAIGRPFENAGLEQHCVVNGVVNSPLHIALANADRVDVICRLLCSLFVFWANRRVLHHIATAKDGSDDGWHNLFHLRPQHVCHGLRAANLSR